MRHHEACRTSYRVGYLCGLYDQPLDAHLTLLSDALRALYARELRAPDDVREQLDTLASGGAAGQALGRRDADCAESWRYPRDYVIPAPVPVSVETIASRRRMARLNLAARTLPSADEIMMSERQVWITRVCEDAALRPSQRTVCELLADSFDERGVYSGTMSELHELWSESMAYDTLRRALRDLASDGVHVVRIRDRSRTSGATYHHALVRETESPSEACARLCGGAPHLWRWDDRLCAWTRLDSSQRRYDVGQLVTSEEAREIRQRCAELVNDEPRRRAADEPIQSSPLVPPPPPPGRT